MDWLDLLAAQGTLKSLLQTTVQKHQFLGTQLSSQSNSHIHTWPQEKPGHVYFFPEFSIWYLRIMKLWKVKLQIRGNYVTKKAEIIALHFQSSLTQSCLFSWEVLSIASLLRNFSLNKCWIVPASYYIDIKIDFLFLFYFLPWFDKLHSLALPFFGIGMKTDLF